MFDHVLVEKTGPIARVTINRPDKLNALNAKVVSELIRAFHDLMVPSSDAEATRCAILTGTGKAFVAGADISQMASMSSVEAKKLAESGHRLGAILEGASFPVIAAVNGFALGGGCELALACDFILAADTAKLGQPEVNLGVIPGFGGTQRLARRVGVAKARELVYTGDMLTAEQALSIGLVNAVYPAADLLTKAEEMAQKIASKAPLAVAAAKRAIFHGSEVSLAAANQLEIEAFAVLFGSEDQKHGMKSFLEKAKPTFTGK
ncbi:MAG: enoyl-CoA hydratase-related protein [Polyangiaceae bacterium]